MGWEGGRWWQARDRCVACSAEGSWCRPQAGWRLARAAVTHGVVLVRHSEGHMRALAVVVEEAWHLAEGWVVSWGRGVRDDLAAVKVAGEPSSVGWQERQRAGGRAGVIAGACQDDLEKVAHELDGANGVVGNEDDAAWGLGAGDETGWDDHLLPANGDVEAALVSEATLHGKSIRGVVEHDAHVGAGGKVVVGRGADLTRGKGI